ncbi:MAG: hypothetical protein PWP51_1577 [Clostridiales bacterium]|jgi:hypothetical protein|nr:hypothetical protein [Clostridiales bacterium]MDN5299024.1 hypothetical protein [Clostridiales bacterium]
MAFPYLFYRDNGIWIADSSELKFQLIYLQRASIDYNHFFRSKVKSQSYDSMYF